MMFLLCYCGFRNIEDLARAVSRRSRIQINAPIGICGIRFSKNTMPLQGPAVARGHSGSRFVCWFGRHSGQKAHVTLDSSRWQWPGSPSQSFIRQSVAIGVFFFALLLRKNNPHCPSLAYLHFFIFKPPKKVMVLRISSRVRVSSNSCFSSFSMRFSNSSRLCIRLTVCSMIYYDGSLINS